ncbi:hypothetical protein Cgig2_007912 [Carnegiea gigantea]|uniref:Chitinase n=1 Tax=Carnegiea gigantea TaxID=171969 RepID=A0A9Q1KFT5_9CARY|nr:hypothetical protein Cgig2_007912 [Carnegiea gigantea]
MWKMSKKDANLEGHYNPQTPGSCSGIGNDITDCQRRGIKVLLSLGGTVASYSLSSAADAQYVVAYFLTTNFYNNTPCQYANDNANNLLSSWNTWTSVNAGQTFVGIPAAPAAATSRYIPPDALRTKVLPQIKASAKYGESCFGLGSTTMGTVTPSRVIYRASSAN